jgi:hypothetical protein
MVTVAIVLAVLAVVLSIIAIVKSGKVVETKVTTKIEHAPVEHPFIYDEHQKTYMLNGGLFVSDFIVCPNTFSKKKEE